MKVTFDAFEQSIEDNAVQFIPQYITRKPVDEKAVLKSMELLRQ